MTCKPEIEETLQESYEQYQQLIESSPVAIGAVYDNKIVFINNTGARLLGFSDPGKLTGSPFLDLLTPDYQKTAKERFKQIREKGKDIPPFDVKIHHVNGTIIDVEITASRFMYRKKPAVQFAFHEISERKKVEDLLFQSKQDWEETFNAITDMVTVHDKDFNIVYANKAAEKTLKLPSVSADSTHKCFSYYHGTACPPHGCPSCACLQTGASANFEIYEPHLKMFVEIRSMPRFDANNQLVGLIHIGRDVTERKNTEETIKRAKSELELRVEERTSELITINEQLKDEIAVRKKAVEALQKSEHKYRTLSKEFNTLLNGIPDNLLLLSSDLKVMWANKSAASVLGKDSSELKGQYCYSLCCNIISPCDNCPTMRSFVSGKEETAEIATFQESIWDIRAFPIKDEAGNVISVIELARDITEKMNLEAGATRTRHLASLGELAAGVAHEINNPINNIINYGQLLKDEFATENRDDEIARRIIKDGERIATIVRSLLSFARIRKEEKCAMDLNEIFSDMLSLTSAQIRKDGIHLKVDIPSKPVKISVHPQQIQQVFLNLISNSRFSLNQKYPGTHKNKTLKIKCEEIKIARQPYVQIEFTDSGTGIPANIIDKVINPFFSTKPENMGTGLGLSISHGIITEHGGKLLIDSVEGEFSKITIKLPVNVKGEK